LKYAQYIERIEAGLKSNPRCFFKFANLKRYSSVYPSAMFLGDTCAHNTQEIANLFDEYFQCFYVRDGSQEDFVVDDGVVPLFR
jgi:predicted glycosyltransferase involved in capsule biosynthesis